MKGEAPTAAKRIVPAALTSRHLLDMSLAQWLGWLLSIPISWLLAWLLGFLLSIPKENLAQTPEGAFQNGLGDAAWHTAPVHHGGPAAYPFCLPT